MDGDRFDDSCTADVVVLCTSDNYIKYISQGGSCGSAC